MGGWPVELILTSDLRRRAKALGACSVPRAGTPIAKLGQEQLIWAIDRNLLTPDEVASLPAPLWALSQSGSGCGYGYGYGYEYGFGYGCGSGDGYGTLTVGNN